jgi:hypothetical protein
MTRNKVLSSYALFSMRATILLALTLLLVVAVVARDVSNELSSDIQWGWAAMRSGPGYASPVASLTVGGHTSLNSAPVSWRAWLHLLPSPFSYSWLMGNYTVGAELSQGCTVRLGPLRYAVYFPLNSYVQAPSFNLYSNFTVVVMYRDLEDVRPYWGAVVGFFVNGSHRWLFNHRDDPRRIKFEVCYATCRAITFDNVVGVARFVAGVFSASGGFMQVYLDGQLHQTLTFTPSGAGILRNANMQIGAYISSYFLYGYVYAVYLYNRTLTSSEVQAIYAWPLSPPPNGLVLWYIAKPQYFNGTHWLDASGNGRHGRIHGGARLVQAVEPVYATSKCGDVEIAASWDGFTARFTYGGQQVASIHAPSYVWFNGRNQYGVVPISFYGWQGLTIEQYVYVPPCKYNVAESKSSAYGARGSNYTHIYFITTATYCYSSYTYVIGYRNLDGVQREIATTLPVGRWQHVVLAFNKSTLAVRIYVNGSLVRQSTWDYQYTIFDYPPSIAFYNRFVLGANIIYGEHMAIAYAYVRIYSRELSADEIRHNYQNFNSPVTRNLEVWLHWDSYAGPSTWLDKSGRGRHATLYGSLQRYPPVQWLFGLYLADAYPQVTPIVVGRLSVNWTSPNVAHWPGGALSTLGAWDASRAQGVAVGRYDGAYIDPSALSSAVASVSIYLGSQYSVGVSGMWTPSDGWNGWLSLLATGSLWLNLTQVGGHGVAAPGRTLRASAGAYALTYSGGVARLYANGTSVAVWQAQLPTNAHPLTTSLLAPGGSPKLRALLHHMWISPGVRLGRDKPSRCGTLYCAITDDSAPYPQEWSYVVDFRWWPPVATWGIIANPPFATVRQRAPSQPLVPVVLGGAYATTQSAWGPFGEICTGSVGGHRYVFGVRYVWLNNETSTCVLPLATTPPASQPTRVGHGVLPPVVPWQHPLLVNSVPHSEPWLVDYSAPYVDASSALQIPYAARACAASFCIQAGRAAGAYSVYFGRPGYALNKTGYVYMFNRFGVSIIDNVALVAPLRGYALVVARDAHLPGVIVTSGNSYYNAWVEYEPRYAVYFPVAGGSYVEVGGVPMDRFTIIAVVAKPDRNRGAGREFLWRGVHVGENFHIYATLGHDDSTSLCIVDSGNALRCVHAQNAFSDSFNVATYVVDGGRLEIYVNGRLAASGSFSRRVDQYVLRFGERDTGIAYPFYVHAAYVYNRSLSYDEIASFRPESPPRQGLIAWYVAEPQFFASGRWFDASGNGRHATVADNVRLVQVAWPYGAVRAGQPAQAHVGPLPGPPTSGVAQAVAAVYVETDGDVAVSTWVPYRDGFEHKTGGYGRGVIPVFGYVGDMVTAAAKVDLAVYGKYAFLVRRGDVHVYSFATELSGSRLDVPIRVPYPGYYVLDVYYNGTRIRSSTYWIDQGGAVYLGVLGPPLALVPAQPISPPTATPIYTAPLQPLQWLPRDLPLPAAVRSNPIEVSAAAALAVALAAAYVTYVSSRRLELGLAAAIVAFFAVVSLLLPPEFRWMVTGWVAFLITVAVLLLVYYLTR